MSEADQAEEPKLYQPPPDWLGGPEITESQLEVVRLRASREDLKRMIYALVEHKNIAVVPDP